MGEGNGEERRSGIVMYRVLLRDISNDPHFLDKIPSEFHPEYLTLYDEEETCFQFMNERDGITVVMDMLSSYIHAHQQDYKPYLLDAKRRLEDWRIYDLTIRMQFS